jgi:hydrogenase nickel incorporation protein HypB
LDRIQANIREINPSVPIFCLSAKTGDGLEPWLGWIREQILLAQRRQQPQ